MSVTHIFVTRADGARDRITIAEASALIGAALTPEQEAALAKAHPQNTDTQIIRSNGEALMADEIFAGLGGGQSFSEVLPITTSGQTQFTLSQTPRAQSEHIHVNGQRLTAMRDYTLSAAFLTIMPALGYTLSTTDVLSVQFEV